MCPVPHSYRAYGLTIHSDIALPELVQSDGPADIFIRRETLNRERPNVPECFQFSRDIQKLDWQGVGLFDVRGRDTIVVDPNEGLSDDIIRMPLLGSVMALLLHLRGIFVVHASAIRTPKHAIAFAADKRGGKSTIASALVTAGYPLITDDVLALASDATGKIVVEPGFPQLKLTQASAAATQRPNISRLSEISFPGFDKHRHRLEEAQFNIDPVPLRRLYLLERGTYPAIEPLSEMDAFMALNRFSYTVRFGRGVLATGDARGFLKTAAALAATGIVRRLIIPDGLDHIASVTSWIGDDAEL